jgi:hypothetical protein
MDLNTQLKVVAEEKKALLGGTDVSLEERCEVLIEALKKTEATGTEAQALPQGFLPLEEFFDTDVTCSAGCIIHPADPEARSQWFFNCLLAYIVFFYSDVWSSTRDHSTLEKRFQSLE